MCSLTGKFHKSKFVERKKTMITRVANGGGYTINTTKAAVAYAAFDLSDASLLLKQSHSPSL